jgi:hypothetical protein
MGGNLTEPREDIKIPTGSDKANEIAAQIEKEFALKMEDDREICRFSHADTSHIDLASDTTNDSPPQSLSSPRPWVRSLLPRSSSLAARPKWHLASVSRQNSRFTGYIKSGLFG